jgi:hypothetical protein
MKKLYSLFTIGAFLFVACSENALPVSGSTSVPNMENNLMPKTPVLCSVMGVTDSLEAVEKGCIWSPTLWNRTSGYRVRTGYDNGTNTSGIWTWHVEPGDGGNVRFEWPGVATDEFDSMALADVIDKCGGSLCGKVIYELNGDKTDSDAEDVFDRRASVEFYFAGKDSLGNIGEIDARAMHGICVEYSGDISVELIPSDSITNLNKISTHGLRTNSLNPENLLSKSKKTCNVFGGFEIYTSGEMDWSKVVPMKEVLAHLKGIRIIFNYNEENTDFDIISIDWYDITKIPMTDAHPYDETCEPIYVDASYCDCEFTTEDRALDVATTEARFQLERWKNNAENDNVLSDLTKECLDNALDSLDSLREIRRSYAFGHLPCDDPHPLAFVCANGSHSTTIEFYEKYGEYMDKIEKPIEEKMIASADSLFNYCMSLKD